MARHQGTDSEPLIIDRAAAAEIPSADAIREWAREKRGFISSVMSELPKERKAAAAAIRAVGSRPIMFEQFGTRRPTILTDRGTRIWRLAFHRCSERFEFDRVLGAHGRQQRRARRKPHAFQNFTRGLLAGEPVRGSKESTGSGSLVKDSSTTALMIAGNRG